MASPSADDFQCQPRTELLDRVSHPRVTTVGWSLNDLVDSSPNFHRVPRLPYSAPDLKGRMSEYLASGIPLIIREWNRHPLWPKSLFTIDWLREHGDQKPSVRNVHDRSDVEIPLPELIEKMRASPIYASAQEQERLYCKDWHCPAKWTEWLTDARVIPDDLLFYGSKDFLHFLPDMAKVETLMCYMGIGDTFTPFHKDACASSGQNLMCYSENGGSSFWFMTKASDAPDVALYFLGLGQVVDLETHVVTLDELRAAPFDVYIAEQCVGDLVLVPPRSCHQVVNSGGITIKTSWSRMSLDGLQAAFYHELPIYHRICREEIYRVKCNIYHAIQHHTDRLVVTKSETELATLVQELKQLLHLFDDVLAQEYTPEHGSLPHVSQSGSTHSDDMRCDFCGADIFQSFFECDKCVASSSSKVTRLGDGLIICPSCYVEGRTCTCGDMQPVQCRVIDDLLQSRDSAVEAIHRLDSGVISEFGSLSKHPSRLLEKGVGIFDSACKLYQQRQSGSKGKSCRPRGSAPSHAVTVAMSCKPCHSSRCFAHLLEVNDLHSVEAISVHERCGGDAGWHEHHQSSHQLHLSSQHAITEDERAGRRPNIFQRLAYLAKTYNACRSISQLTQSGWYDDCERLNVAPIAPSITEVKRGLPDDAAGDQATLIDRTVPSVGPVGGVSCDANAILASAGDGITPMLIDPFPESSNALSELHGSPSALSVLTELPSDYECSLLTEVAGTFPSAPSTSFIVANHQQPCPQESTGRRRQKRVLMDFVHVPQPQWYREMCNKRTYAAQVLSKPSTRKETPESDDIPIKELVQRLSLPASKAIGVGKLPNHKSNASTMPRLSAMTTPIPRVSNSVLGRLSGRTAPHPSMQKRKGAQHVPPQSPISVKRARLAVLDPPRSESKGLADALNETFGCMDGHRYVSVGVQKDPNFTKSLPVAANVETSCALERLVEENKGLRVQLSAREKEKQDLEERLGVMQRLIPGTGSSSSTVDICSDAFSFHATIPRNNRYCNTSPKESPNSGRSFGFRPAEGGYRRRPPTQPRGHWKRKYNSRPVEREHRNYPPNEHRRNWSNREAHYRTYPYKSVNGPSPSQAELTFPADSHMNYDMAEPDPSTAQLAPLSPTRTSDQSQSSTCTDRAQQDSSEESTPVTSDVSSGSLQPKYAGHKRAMSEDEVSLGDEDEYLPNY